MITYVYAQDLEGGIGYQGSLPWSLPNDMNFFKETTMIFQVIMAELWGTEIEGGSLCKNMYKLH